MICAACGCWVEIEEPNPTDLGFFLCDKCIDQGAAPPRDDWEEHGDGR
jgi:hypothetical protein